MILFCDVERPLYLAPMRWFNRIFASVVMTASATQNVEGEPVGALNKFFFYAYKGRMWAKSLKAKNRTAYYAGKWMLIVGLAYLLFFRGLAQADLVVEIETQKWDRSNISSGAFEHLGCAVRNFFRACSRCLGSANTNQGWIEFLSS